MDDAADGADPGGAGKGTASGGQADAGDASKNGNTGGDNDDGDDGSDAGNGKGSSTASDDDKDDGSKSTGDDDDNDDGGGSGGSGSSNGDDDDDIDDDGNSGSIGKGGLEIEEGEDSFDLYAPMKVTTNKHDKGGGTVRVRRLNGDDDDDWESVTLPKSDSVEIDNMCFNRDKTTEVEVEFEYSKGTLRLGTKDMKVKSRRDQSATIATEYDGCFIDLLCGEPDDTTFTLSCPKSDLDVE